MAVPGRLRAARALGLAPPAEAVPAAESTARPICGWLAGALLAAAVVGAYAYETYQNVALHAMVFSRSKAWYLLTTAQVLATALVALLAGGGGARRAARLLRAARLMQTINVTNKVKAPTRRGRGELVAWTVLVFGLALGLIFLAVISITQTAATMASCAFTFTANIVKVLLVLHYLCLISLMDSSLASLIDLLNEIGLELNSREDHDTEVYERACNTVRGVHRSYLALGRLVREADQAEGPTLLTLFATNTLKAMHYLFWLQSVPDAPELPASAAGMAMIACGVTAMCFEIVQTVLLVEACQRTAATLATAGPALAALLDRAAPRGRLAGACAAFCASLHGEPPTFSPLGLCTFSRALMIEVFGFCVTFVAIMRQFNLKERVSGS